MCYGCGSRVRLVRILTNCSAEMPSPGPAADSELVRLVDGCDQVAVKVPGGEQWTFFSREEKEARQAGAKGRRPGLHTPTDFPGAAQALEISVLALCGRAPCPPRRYAFALASLVCLLLCAAGGYLYPRDPEFTLTPVQKGFGFVGVFAVLASGAALACVWYPGWFARCTTRRCPLSAAPALLIFCEDGSQHKVAVTSRKGPRPEGGAVRCADFRHARFCYSPGADAFLLEEPADMLADAEAYGLAFTQGLEAELVGQRAEWHGSNLIDVPMPSIGQQLMDEVLNPFVFFQLFSCTQWLLQKYWKYSLIVFLITLLAACISLVISRQNFARLRELSHHEALVNVRRGTLERVLSTQLVPGDIFEVEENMDLPCDALLVAGECLVSEAMLTGESVPVAKTAAVPGGGPAPAKAHLSGGTKVLQTRAPPAGGLVLARVARTGFATEKGRLIRSILFPRAGRMDLTRDGNRFVGWVLMPMAVAGGIASCVHALQQGKSFTIASALDLVSIAVPPALPATMMVGVATAVSRLRKRAIFCIAPNRVNMAGRISRVCFDKTGTLTWDGLTMQGLQPVGPGPTHAAFTDEVPADRVVDACNVAAVDTAVEALALVMAGCQSLRHLTSPGGEAQLVGDPLEVVMLQSSGWSLHAGAAGGAVNVRSPGGTLCATQTQVFDFNSEHARMAACVSLTDPRTGAPLDRAARVLIKGSPEAVASLCAPASVPGDFEAVLARYAGLGYRVLGAAERELAPSEAAAAAAGSLSREQAEGQGLLRFCGLVVLENQLKPSSAGVIAALQAADVQCVMVTGDHARTAVTVARAANIVSRDATCILVDAVQSPKDVRQEVAYTVLAHAPGTADRQVDAATALGPDCCEHRYVATGAGFDALTAAAEAGSPGALHTVLPRLSVAARFQPHQKQGVVGLFIQRGDFTAFVGDGANDSAALKAADVGLSLTADAEASVAAPFTSKNADIVSCITLLLEGRAALATSFQVFKFMALYAAVQFSCSLQMNLANSYLSEYEFLWVDLLVVLPLSALLPQTRAYHQLTSRRPCASLLHWSVVASVAGQMGINLGFQLAIRALTRAQCWFQPQDFQCCTRTYVPAATTSTCPLLPPPGQCIACTEAFSAIVPSYENTTLWLLSNAQYLWLAAALAISRPFRQPQYTNLSFTVCWLGLLACTVALIFSGSRFVLGTFDLIALPDANFRWAVMTLALLSGLCTFGWEAAIEETMVANAMHKEPPLRRVLFALRQAYHGRDTYDMRVTGA